MDNATGYIITAVSSFLLSAGGLYVALRRIIVQAEVAKKAAAKNAAVAKIEAEKVQVQSERVQVQSERVVVSALKQMQQLVEDERRDRVDQARVFAAQLDEARRAESRCRHEMSEMRLLNEEEIGKLRFENSELKSQLDILTDKVSELESQVKSNG